MTQVLIPAALYPASTRLLMALVLGLLFWLALPRQSPRPLARAVISVIVAGWLFGATLIWGTGGPSKIRGGLELSVWQGDALLALAGAGVLAAAVALRCFAHRKPRAGWALTAIFAVSFTGWSAVVRYSVPVASVVLAIGVGALVFAGIQPTPRAGGSGQTIAWPAAAPRAKRWLWNAGAAALPLLTAPVFYLWLKISPKSWADPACGLSSWALLTFIPFLALPAITAWTRTRTIGKGREAAAAAVVLAATVTVGGCILAFLVWFGVNQCGE